jgi:hypothetical protein
VDDALLELRAINEIVALKGRYWRGIDLKDPVLLRSVFTGDAIFDLSLAMGEPARDVAPYSGPDRFVHETLSVLTGVVTVHHGHTPEISLTRIEPE